MFQFLKRNGVPAPNRIVDVGWFLDTEQSSFIWDAPRKHGRDDPANRHAKSVAKCPAVIDHEARIFEVPCPIDLQLRFSFDEKQQPKLSAPAGDQSPIRTNQISKMVAMVSRKEWRHPDRPVLQIITPYHFVADETVYMTQLPPFNHYRKQQLPGVLIGGRMPINIWVRPMMWAFEWFDTSQDLILRRGEPWFYVRFETDDPSRPVRMVEAEITPELREFMKGAKSVTNYVNRTFSLFSTAKERRPKTLLVPKKR